MQITKRGFFHLCGGAAVAVLASELPDLVTLPKGRGRIVEVELLGRKVLLEELPQPSKNTVFAQYRYTYYQYTYRSPYANYGRYQQWAYAQYQAQYQAYMQTLIEQYSWIQNYRAQMAAYMQEYYSQSYQMSQPFPLDSVRSIYSYGSSSNSEIVLGLNKRREQVLAQGKSVRAMAVIASITDSDDDDDDEKEMSAAPQTSSRSVTTESGAYSIAGSGYGTANGSAFISSREYKNVDTEERGSILIYDTKAQKETRLVAV
jgi:hypothetical protein